MFKKLILPLCLLSLSISAWADVMTRMNQRIDNYQSMKAPAHCAEPATGFNYAKANSGFMGQVDCAIICSNGKKISKKSDSSFVPKSYGLSQGDGPLWRSLSVTIKIWSEEVCLQEASEACKGLTNVENSVVNKISSGEWSIDHFPGCNEKSPMLSPFESTVKSDKIPPPMASGLELGNFGQRLAFYDQIHKAASLIKPTEECKHRMNTDLCFGDCIYSVTKGEALKETLATPEPIMREKSSWCMDGFVAIAKMNKKLSKQVQIKACEAFLWSNMMYSNTPGSSCSAIRGDHECEKLVDGL